MANARPDVVVLEMVRLSFPKIWKMEKSTPDSPPKFSANFLIDPDTAHGKKNIAKIEAALKAHDFDEEDIWDIAAISAFFGMSNRLANVTSMRPNAEFYALGR